MNVGAEAKKDGPPGSAGPMRLEEALLERFGSRARFAEPMARHTSFRIGGPADVWVEVESVEELSDLLALAVRFGTKVFPLGGGTNVLVSDRGVRGIVLHLGRSFDRVEWTFAGDGASVVSGAAISFKKLVTEAAERGLEGLEFAEGIPGSLGGGLTMNAGAFGGEISRVVDCMEGVTRDGQRRKFEKTDLAFEYRRLDLPPGFVITAVRLRLRRGDPAEIASRMRSAQKRRKERQPLGLPNAGSIFKNPSGTAAGRLLEEAGVKGWRVGGAQVSERHANFIVNEGNATAEDVWTLMQKMRERVLAHSGVLLEPEVKLVGDW